MPQAKEASHSSSHPRQPQTYAKPKSRALYPSIASIAASNKPAPPDWFLAVLLWFTLGHRYDSGAPIKTTGTKKMHGEFDYCRPPAPKHRYFSNLAVF
jgi:hypothetical protein